MTNYFIDGGAAGTGDGLTPANGMVDIRSAPFADGDFVWVRRTHKNDYTNSQFIGPNSYNSAFSKWCHLTGWPNSGDLLYDQRPAAGVSASWDADNATTQAANSYGLNWPTLCCSQAGTITQAGFLPGRGINISNFYMVNCSGVGNAFSMAYLDFEELCYFDNVMFLNNNGPMTGFTVPAFSTTGKRFRNLWVVASNAGVSAGGFIGGQIYADKITVHSHTIFNTGLMDTRSSFYVGHVQNWSSSLANLVSPTAGEPAVFVTPTCYIKRATGTLTFSGFNQHINTNPHEIQAVIDDYFGKGPMNSGVPAGNEFVLATSAEATFGGTRAMKFAVRSFNAGAHWYWQRYFYNNVAKQFSVTSGTQVAIRVPIYVDSTGVHTPSGGLWRGQLYTLGAGPKVAVQSNVITGSATSWVGSLIAGGSAYFLEFKWTPIETKSDALFEASFPKLTQATSGAQITAYALMGEPYAI